MFIETVSTPNPNTLKFIPGCDVLPGSTKEYTNAMQAQESPLAEKIFAIDGISGVFFSDDFITVTKTKFEWPQLKPIILGEIMDHFISCSGCPSSTMTLKNGIENLLKHYVPEVMEVQAI